MGLRELSGADLCRLTGYTPQTVSAKMNGSAVISMTDADNFANALGVEPSVFFLEPDDAVRWVLDHRAIEVGAIRSWKCSTFSKRRHRVRSTYCRPESTLGELLHAV